MPKRQVKLQHRLQGVLLSYYFEHDHHPETEIDRVTTPMGCTISGLNEMEHFGLSSAMIKGIVKSYSGISDLK